MMVQLLQSSQTILPCCRYVLVIGTCRYLALPMESLP